jgi:hypothetical protein
MPTINLVMIPDDQEQTLDLLCLFVKLFELNELITMCREYPS